MNEPLSPSSSKEDIIRELLNYPIHTLSEEEINNPYLVINDVFSFGHLPDLQAMLWNSFKANITGTYHKDLTRRERKDVVYLYEYMTRLLEANHLLYKRRPLKEAGGSLVSFPFDLGNVKQANIESISAKATIPCTDELQNIVRVIVQITNAEKLFLVSLTTGINERLQYDLLALIPAGSTQPFKEYQRKVESKCSELGSVILWCGHTDHVYKLLEQRHMFYSAVCTTDRLLYDNGRPALPVTGVTSIAILKAKARSAFTDLFYVATSFLDGAEYYATIERWKTAAFLLHQATEVAFRSLLYPLTGYHKYGHNLTRLLRLCAYCAPELYKVFPQDSDKEQELFRLLNMAYVLTRYRLKYEISREDVMLLLDRVNILHTETDQFFNEKLIAIENFLS